MVVDDDDGRQGGSRATGRSRRPIEISARGRPGSYTVDTSNRRSGTERCVCKCRGWDMGVAKAPREEGVCVGERVSERGAAPARSWPDMVIRDGWQHTGPPAQMPAGILFFANERGQSSLVLHAVHNSPLAACLDAARLRSRSNQIANQPRREIRVSRVHTAEEGIFRAPGAGSSHAGQGRMRVRAHMALLALHGMDYMGEHGPSVVLPMAIASSGCLAFSHIDEAPISRLVQTHTRHIGTQTFRRPLHRRSINGMEIGSSPMYAGVPDRPACPRFVKAPPRATTRFLHGGSCTVTTSQWEKSRALRRAGLLLSSSFRSTARIRFAFLVSAPAGA